VLLRAMRRDDLPRRWAFNNSVEVELASGGDPPIPQSLERLEAEFDADVGRGGRDGASFAIEADGVFIGSCALFNFNEAAHTCELGIVIGDTNYHGKGYGREAIMLLLDYAFRLRNFRKVYLTVNGDNERAQRAYRACGFAEEGRWRQHVWSAGQYVDLVGMGIFQSGWLERTKGE
jgi:RimJ/RimL family protein N-acetyltransferase